MPNSEITTINQNQLIELKDRYQSLCEEAKTDTSFKSDYEAAVLAPSLFLIDVSAQKDFDFFFDKIIHHFMSAYQKAGEEERVLITRAMDELIHEFIYTMQRRIETTKDKASTRSLVGSTLERIKEVSGSALKFAAVGAAGTAGGIVSGATGGLASPVLVDLGMALMGKATGVSEKDGEIIVNSSIGLLQDFTGFLSSNWAKGKDENYFFGQLLFVYQRIIASDAYSIGLFPKVAASYERNKEVILPLSLEQQGLHPTTNLLALDSSEVQKSISANLIVKNLINLALKDSKNWESLIDCLKWAENESPVNYEALKREAVASYEVAYRKNKKRLLYSPVDFKAKVELNDKEWHEYVQQKSKRKRQKTLIISSVSIILIITLVSAFFVKQSSYEAMAKIEKERITTAEAEISTLINQTKFSDASQKINTELKWNVRNTFVVFPYSTEDVNQTIERNLAKKVELLNAIRDKVEVLCNNQMDESTYKSATENLSLFTSVYNQFDYNMYDVS